MQEQSQKTRQKKRAAEEEVQHLQDKLQNVKVCILPSYIVSIMTSCIVVYAELCK